MSIKVECDNCFAVLKLKSASALGRTVPCPKCSELFVVKEMEEEEDDFLGGLDIGDGGYGESEEAPQALPNQERRKLKKKTKTRRSAPVENEGFNLGAWGFPLWVACGSIGGLLGASIWLMIAYNFLLNIGWLAVLVGFLSGLGVRIVARESEGFAPGLTAAAIALFSIALAHMVLAYFVVNGVFGPMGGFAQVAEEVMDVETMILQEFADEIVDERVEKGVIVDWPEDPFGEDQDLEDGIEFEIESIYPEDVWAEAKQRWDDLPEEEQQAKLDETQAVRDLINENQGAIQGGAILFVFFLTFGCIDIFIVPFSAWTAFKVGANMGEN